MFKNIIPSQQSSPNIWTMLRPVLVVGVLLLSAAIAYIGSYKELVLVIALLASLPMLLVAIRYPSLGLIAILVSGMAIPITGPSGVNPTMGLVALFTGLWIFGMVVQDREVKLTDSRTTRPLIIMVVGACLSFIIGQLRWFDPVLPAPIGAQLGALSMFILAAFAFFLGANQIKDLRWLRWMVWAFVGCAAFFLVTRMLPFSLPGFFKGGEYRGIMVVWFGSLAFSMALYNKDLSWPWRLAFAALTLLIVYYTFILKYREKSGWMPLLLSFAVIWAVRSKRAALVVILLGLIPAIGLVSDALASDDYSVSTRMDALVIMLQIAKTNPLFGLGPANYRWYTALFAIRGFDVAFNSHNNYADILAQNGLVGVFSFLWIFIEVGWLAFKLRYRVVEGFARAYIFAALGATAGTVVAAAMADWVIPFFYNLGMQGFRSSAVGWLLSGAVVSVGHLALKTSQEQSA
ncbi:MAG: O-antigen ligase family protein [Ardenticatenaceae bacterium]|nr:O-antigen ligase family protein [Ardenticatenaceae bacterium]